MKDEDFGPNAQFTEDIFLDISQKTLPKSIGQMSHYICRRDGMVLYATVKNPSPTLGALACGLWQASQELKKVSFQTNNLFKLSFESSSEGILFNEIEGNSELFLITTYSNVVNPGLVKAKLRILTAQLKNFSLSKKSGNFLFSDLSDNEIDNLFSFAAGE